jgi:DNA-binding NtrC family response regulator
MGKPHLLIIDDNKTFTESVAFTLTEFQVEQAHSVLEGKQKLNSKIDIVLLDLVFNEKYPEKQEGLGLIPFIREECPDTQIIVLTNYPSIETTVHAIKAGATDFLNKRDLNWDEWKLRLKNYANSAKQIRQLKERNIELERISDDQDILGISSEIEYLRCRLRDIAKNSSDAVVFLTGETGTGKNHAARYFRKHSPRATEAYKEFSILELSESLVESELFGHVKGAFTGANENKKGLFEQADGGILFLDEIGDYDLKIQTKILRFIDEKVITPVGGGKSKKLDLQLILASNQDIPCLISDKKFRQDLYQRMNRIRINITPLRHRKEDIPILAEYFFHHFREKEKTKLISIEPKVMEVFKAYQWPGNIRELQSAIWDACTKARLFGDTILQVKHLKQELQEPLTEASQKSAENTRGTGNNQEKIAMLELQAIEDALEKSFGQKTIAAKLLGINADQLRYKVLKYYNSFPDIVRGFDSICSDYRLR